MTEIFVTDDQCFLDGVDITNKVSRVEMSLAGKGKQEVAIILTKEVGSKVHLEDVEVNLVEPESDASVLRRAISFIRELDSEEVEAAALEAQQWGSPGSLTPAILESICEVFKHAADELEGIEEVRGSADDGPDQGDEATSNE